MLFQKPCISRYVSQTKFIYAGLSACLAAIINIVRQFWTLSVDVNVGYSECKELTTLKYIT